MDGRTLTRLCGLTDFFSDERGCWVFRGSRTVKGYGRFRYQGRLQVPHRVMYEHCGGTIPPGFTLDHLCRNPSCINPYHLEPVTVAENIRRGTQGWNQSVKTHCPAGHAYDAENTYVNPRGQRLCRACGRLRMRERRAKERSAA